MQLTSQENVKVHVLPQLVVVALSQVLLYLMVEVGEVHHLEVLEEQEGLVHDFQEEVQEGLVHDLQEGVVEGVLHAWMEDRAVCHQL